MTSPALEIFGVPEGGPVPAIDSADMQKAYELIINTERKHASECLGIGAGFYEGVCSPDADLKAVAYRVGILGAMVKVCSQMADSPYAPYLDGDQLHSAVFRVAARAPLRWLSRKSGFPFDMTWEEFFGEIQKEQH